MFRFTIRELVLLTLVVAMGVAWWLDRESLSAWHVNRLDRFLEELGQEGVWVIKGDDGLYHLPYVPPVRDLTPGRIDHSEIR
jgi:hypothetical protein